MEAMMTYLSNFRWIPIGVVFIVLAYIAAMMMSHREVGKDIDEENE